MHCLSSLLSGRERAAAQQLVGRLDSALSSLPKASSGRDASAQSSGSAPSARSARSVSRLSIDVAKYFHSSSRMTPTLKMSDLSVGCARDVQLRAA